MTDGDAVAVVPAIHVVFGPHRVGGSGQLSDGVLVGEVVDRIDHAGLRRLPGFDYHESWGIPCKLVDPAVSRWKSSI